MAIDPTGKLRIASTTSKSGQAKGKLFEKLAISILDRYGYQIDPIPSTNYAGMEVDLEGKHRLFDIPVYVECKYYESQNIDSPMFKSFYGMYSTRHQKNPKAHGVFIAVPAVNSHVKAFYNEYCLENPQIHVSILNEVDVLSSIVQFKGFLSVDRVRSLFPENLGRISNWEILYTDLGLFWLQYVVTPGKTKNGALFVLDELAHPITASEASQLFEKLGLDFGDLVIIDLCTNTRAIHSIIASANRESLLIADRDNFIHEFCINLRTKGNSEKTIRAYRLALQKYENESSKLVITSKREDIEAWLQSLTLKATSYSKYVYTFRSFFKWAIKQGYVHQDPTLHIEQIKISDTNTRKVSFSDLEYLLASIPDKTPIDRRDAAIIATLMYTGMKSETLVSLKCSDIDLKNGLITITLKHKRKLKIHAQLHHFLEAWLKQHPTRTGSLFVGMLDKGEGKGISYDGIRHMLNKRTTNAKLDYHVFTCQAIRNTVTEIVLSNRGVHPGDAKKLLGFSSMESMLRHADDAEVIDFDGFGGPRG